MKIKSFIVIFSISITLTAQNYDFGKVSKEELLEKQYSTDSSANAAYLYKNRKSFFRYIKGQGFILITEVHERIKIYNKDGFGYATKSIPLYKKGSTNESVNGLKGYTYNLIDDNIVDSKLKKDGVFKAEMSKYYDETKFTMPNIKVGSVIEYKYEVQSPFLSNVDEFRFQYAIPVKKIEARFIAPEYFSFKVNSKGFLSVIPEKETKRGKISYVNTNKYNLGGRQTADRTSYSTSSIDYTEYIDNYNLSNIPALKEEPHVNNIRNYRSAVKYELSFTKFPNSTIEYYATTWKDVVKNIYENSSFGSELDKSGYYKSDIDALIGTVSDPMEKTALIFNYVKSNVNWNGYYSKYSSDGLRKAYKEHKGNSADINLMLTSMLRYAGIDANPVLVSTRQHGIPLFPTREGYNYVVCGLEVPNNVILLDATNQYSIPNVLPFRALNWQGRIIRKSGGSSLIDLYPKRISKNTISLSASLDEEGTLEGTMRAVKTGHKALSYRQSYNNVNEDEFIEKLENKFKGIEVFEFNVKNNDKLNKPVMESCKFSIESQADVIDDKIYFSPMLFFKTNESPFKLETREFPVDFGYPSEDVYRFTLKLPESYRVESIPDSKVLKLPDNLGSYTYQIGVNGNTLQLVVDSKINVPIVSPTYYDALKAYFSGLIEAENEQIVLTRI